MLEEIVPLQNDVAIPDSELVSLADRIVQDVEKGRQILYQTINRTIVQTYWKVGHDIVEFEQGGKAHAKYGTAMLTNLSHLLRSRLGRGYSRPNLNNMRKFYLLYPNCQISDKLTWSHICELVTIDDELERSFYEKECVAAGWNVDSLQRQIDSGLFLRLASSSDKEGVLQLANEGIKLQQPKDAVRDTYTLEFLGLDSMAKVSEARLEKSLIDNMQTFLLELGKGFTFVKRQYPLMVNNKRYKVDLVFYHRILRCFVLIDLKKGAVRHKDIGQMNMYMGYFAKEENMPDDNPPIGIVLSRFKDELLVEYATYGMDSNLFVSQYELYLPNKDELRNMVNDIIANHPKMIKSK